MVGTLGANHIKQIPDVLALKEILQIARQLPPPVWIFIRRSRQIWLIAFAGEILELKLQQPAIDWKPKLWPLTAFCVRYALTLRCAMMSHSIYAHSPAPGTGAEFTFAASTKASKARNRQSDSVMRQLRRLYAIIAEEPIPESISLLLKPPKN
jgi:hypothetical protein